MISDVRELGHVISLKVIGILSTMRTITGHLWFARGLGLFPMKCICSVHHTEALSLSSHQSYQVVEVTHLL